MAEEQNQDEQNQDEQNQDEQNQDAAATEQQQAQFQLQKLYMKDVSFELPNAPQIFQEDGQVEIKMNLAQRVENLAEGVHEVVLTVTVTATLGEKTAYLAEVQQAGIFSITGPERTGHARRAEHALPPHAVSLRPPLCYRPGSRWWFPAAGIAADQF